MSQKKTWLLLSVLLTVCACGGSGGDSTASGSGDGTSKIVGTVTDNITGLPLKDALVKSTPVTEEFQTGSDGMYTLNVNLDANTEFRVFAEHIGYDGADGRTTLARGNTANVDLQLRRTVAGLVASPYHADDLKRSRYL